MHWIESSGGPLILIEKQFLDEWGGVETSSDKNYTSDYDRACDTDEYADVMSIPSGYAVVLGDEPDRTTIKIQSEKEATIVRWRWAPSENVIQEVLNKLKLSIFDNAEILRFCISGADIILFDSSFQGDETFDSLEATLKPGEYVLKTTMFEPDSETCLLLHKLVLVSASPKTPVFPKFPQ